LSRGSFVSTAALRVSERLPNIFETPQPPRVDPYGDTNKVDFQKGWVRLEGVFTAEQLKAVLAELAKRKKS
jgi:hypothetical protein